VIQLSSAATPRLRPVHDVMRRPQVHLCLLLGLALATPLFAQSQGYSRDSFRDLPPTSSHPDSSRAPRLAFVLEAEIPLPGPLPGEAPTWDGDRVFLSVAGGSVRAFPAAGATPDFTAGPATLPLASDSGTWVENETGRFRYRATEGGTIQAQRRCRRCKAGWKKRWKLRVPGSSLAPPVVDRGRIYFGSLDNRVYCVKARNGHRIWVSDIGGRLSSGLVRWGGAATPLLSEAGPDLGLILALPDGGAKLVALDTEAGRQVALVRLGDGEGKFVPGPLITSEGKVVVARQKYLASEASLMVYRLTAIQPPAPAATTPDEAPPAASTPGPTAPPATPAPR